MRLSRLYSNQPDIFAPIVFRKGLNVVLGVITKKSSSRADTHNLGKSLLGRLIDYCLLLEPDKDFFLIRHRDRFAEMQFYLELDLEGQFVTISRRVDSPELVSVVRHADSNLTSTAFAEWDHASLPVAKAKQWLNSVLDFKLIAPWGYRNIVGYHLRSQKDYVDVFRLSKYRGKDIDWKPLLAQLFGLNGVSVSRVYELQQQQKRLRKQKQDVSKLLSSRVARSEAEGSIEDKRKLLSSLRAALDLLDLKGVDTQREQQLLSLNRSIELLRERRYELLARKERLRVLKTQGIVAVDTERLRELFAEATEMLGERVVKDFDALVRFRRDLQSDRSQGAADELKLVDAELARIRSDTMSLETQRESYLAEIRLSDVYHDVVALSRRIADMSGEIGRYEGTISASNVNSELQGKIDVAERSEQESVDSVSDGLALLQLSPDSDLNLVRGFVRELFLDVLGRVAAIGVAMNRDGHLDFSAVVPGVEGDESAAADGSTYTRLLCVALDLALVRCHFDVKYPRFLFHDGVLEAVEVRKKQMLMAHLRRVADSGVQYIMTAIDSELIGPQTDYWRNEDVVLRLTDEGDRGRLFRMPEW